MTYNLKSNSFHETYGPSDSFLIASLKLWTAHFTNPFIPTRFCTTQSENSEETCKHDRKYRFSESYAQHGRHPHHPDGGWPDYAQYKDHHAEGLFGQGLGCVPQQVQCDCGDGSGHSLIECFYRIRNSMLADAVNPFSGVFV